MTDKVLKKLAEYQDKFGDIFPLMQLPFYGDEDEIIAAVNKCLNSGKTAREVFSILDDVDY